MKKYKKRILFLGLLLLVSAAFAGCLTREERMALERKAREAVNWYAEKYELARPRIESKGYISKSEMFGAVPTENMYFRMEDGNTVTWVAAEARFGDNRQSEEIQKALMEEYWEPALERLKEKLGADRVETLEEEVLFNIWRTNCFEEAVFTTFYQGDIKHFLRRETLYLDGLTIYAVCGPEQDYHTILREFGESLQERFEIRGRVKLFAMSDEYYQAWSEEESPFSFYQDGCYLSYEVSAEKLECYEANYIQIMPGLYVTLSMPDIMLEEGEVFIEEELTQAELQALLDKRYESLPDYAKENRRGSYMKHDKAHVDRAIVHTNTAVMRLGFSDRVRKAAAPGGIHCYFRLCPEEFPEEYQISEGAALYYYPDKEASYQCYSLCSSERQTDYLSVLDNYLFFIGSQSYIPFEDSR